MRQCSRCKQFKSLDQFSFKNKQKKKHSFYCKECNQAYQKKHYLNNKLYYQTKHKLWRASFRKIIRSKIIEYFKNHPCVDCGEMDYSVLEFDHVKGNKIDNVASLLACDVSWEVLKKEIDKCEVRCANCHKRRSAKLYGWYKYE